MVPCYLFQDFRYQLIIRIHSIIRAHTCKGRKGHLVVGYAAKLHSPKRTIEIRIWETRHSKSDQYIIFILDNIILETPLLREHSRYYEWIPNQYFKSPRNWRSIPFPVYVFEKYIFRILGNLIIYEIISILTRIPYADLRILPTKSRLRTIRSPPQWHVYTTAEYKGFGFQGFGFFGYTRYTKTEC